MNINLKRFWLKKNVSAFLGFLGKDVVEQELARIDTMTEAEMDEMAEAITNALERDGEDD